MCNSVRRRVQDVLDAIQFFTATDADVERLPTGGFLITSPGYRAGPAGDH